MDGKEEAVFRLVIDNELKKLDTKVLVAELDRRKPCEKCRTGRGIFSAYAMCKGCVFEKKDLSFWD